MGSVPQHPFFKRVIDELKNYDRSWVLWYITVMASTGPLFLSIIWRHWGMEGLNTDDSTLAPDGGRVRILFPEEYQNYAWRFFKHHLGNSWHGADTEFIFWVSSSSCAQQLRSCVNVFMQMARNWVFLTVLGFTLGGALVFFVWWAYNRLYPTKAQTEGMPKWKSASIRSRFGFWRRASARKEYELVSRHEV